MWLLWHDFPNKHMKNMIDIEGYLIQDISFLLPWSSFFAKELIAELNLLCSLSSQLTSFSKTNQTTSSSSHRFAEDECTMAWAWPAIHPQSARLVSKKSTDKSKSSFQELPPVYKPDENNFEHLWTLKKCGHNGNRMLESTNKTNDKNRATKNDGQTFAIQPFVMQLSGQSDDERGLNNNQEGDASPFAIAIDEMYWR